MKIVTAEQMKRIDEAATARLSIPSLILMENAAQALLRCLEFWVPDLPRKNVLVVAGKGNNGGDGIAAARILHSNGGNVEIVLLASPEELKGDALQNFHMAQRSGVPIHPVAAKSVEDWPQDWAHRDVILDGILGTGTRGPVSGQLAPVIDWINRRFNGHVVSIDLPSGMEADSGQISGPCICADATVTFTAPKLCHILLPSSTICGKVWLAPIGVPDFLLEEEENYPELITRRCLHPVFCPREASSHKGDYGRILILAGSRGKSGAASMAGLAALRSGAGLVTVAVPRGIQSAVAAFSPEYMTEGLPENWEGTLSEEAADALLSMISTVDLLAVGPGIGTGDEVIRCLKKLLGRCTLPLVVDADAINIMALSSLEIPSHPGRPVVLTPHPGEMARLMGVSIRDVQSDRISAARQAAGKTSCHVILKGARTVIASPDGKISINPTGNPGMATAGSGDILLGMVAALMAQQLNSSLVSPETDGILPALKAAVYWHGMAGDRFAASCGQIPLIAGDILARLAETFPLLTRKENLYPGGLTLLFPPEEV